MPPALLRRIWRLGEEAEVRAALQDLLVFSPNRKVMAERAAYWAARMMGGTAGFVIDADGKVLAATGIDPKHAAALIEARSEPVITAPLHLAEGIGQVAVVAGQFTPVFGSEEVAQLQGFANAVSAGIDRTRVTERMAALESNKTQFLNLASHELRGPLTVIRGYVSMMSTGMLGQLNERGRKAADVMSAKVLEMNELIEEMIEAARLEEGGVTLRAVETDLRDIARDAAEIVAPLLESKHNLVMDLPERKVRVNVDPDRTKTIVANLLSNAIKYSPDGGTITCQVRSRAGTARVAVSDHGIGISREGMATLFTRFGRVITPQTEHLKGTGLGLFLGRQLARLQGGDITVASVEGEGSTFTLQLPAAPAVDAVAGNDGSGAPAAQLASTD
jgi:signal transduction histidine kinase